MPSAPDHRRTQTTEELIQARADRCLERVQEFNRELKPVGNPPDFARWCAPGCWIDTAGQWHADYDWFRWALELPRGTMVEEIYNFALKLSKTYPLDK